MNKFNENIIRETAYYIWKNNGCPSNTSTQDWNAAIAQLSNLTNNYKDSAIKLASATNVAMMNVATQPLTTPTQLLRKVSTSKKGQTTSVSKAKKTTKATPSKK